MKALLYCPKTKPRLIRGYGYLDFYLCDRHKNYMSGAELKDMANGKIVGECDFEVEEHKETTKDWLCMNLREKIIFGFMCKKASIEELECYKYANGKPLYAIHIKNLEVFDELKELGDYYTIHSIGGMLLTDKLKRAPQNMQRVSLNEWDYGTYNPKDIAILIPVYSEELYRIIKDKQDLIIRKKCIKELL